MLAGAAATLGAHAALAVPALSVTNFGLRPRDVPRRNAWFEIDAAAFEHNIAETRAILGPGGAELCAIMKADAYGNGLDLLMPSVLKTGITAIGFSSNEEARIARAMNFKGRLIRVRTGDPGRNRRCLPLRSGGIGGQSCRRPAHRRSMAGPEQDACAAHPSLPQRRRHEPQWR